MEPRANGRMQIKKVLSVVVKFLRKCQDSRLALELLKFHLRSGTPNF